jgi:acetyl-CoA carboxylase biotin carboxyl carrier protein
MWGSLSEKEFLVADEQSKSNSPGPFDVRTVKNLVALMASHDLAEIDLRDGMQRLRIRRGGAQTFVSAMPALTHAPAPVAAPAPQARPAEAPPAAAPAPGKKYLEIKSESVGTFYSKPSPDAPPYVSVGSKVSANTVVCQLEAMKLFSEVQAGISGTVVEVLVDNQSPVEFGQVLFRVEG